MLSGLTLHALDNQTLTSVLQSPVRKHQLCVRRQPSHVPLFNPPVFPSSQPCPPLKPMDAQCLSPAESLPRSLGSGWGCEALGGCSGPPSGGLYSITKSNLPLRYGWSKSARYFSLSPPNVYMSGGRRRVAEPRIGQN